MLELYFSTVCGECQIICVNCPDHNSDFIELSKSCKVGNPCLDRIPAIRVMIIKQSMRIFRQFTYTDNLTRPFSNVEKLSFYIPILFSFYLRQVSYIKDLAGLSLRS